MCSRRDTHTHLVLVLELGKATSQYDHILLFAGWQLSLGDSLVARLGIYASCLGTAVWEERDVDASVGLREYSIGTRSSTSSRLLPLLREVTVEDDLLVCGGRGRMTESVFTLVDSERESADLHSLSGPRTRSLTLSASLVEGTFWAPTMFPPSKSSSEYENKRVSNQQR